MPPQAEFRADRPESRNVRARSRACLFFAQKSSPFGRQNVRKCGTKIRKQRMSAGSSILCGVSCDIIMTKARQQAEGSQPGSKRSPQSLVCIGTSTTPKFLDLAVPCSTLRSAPSDPCGLCSTSQVVRDATSAGRLLVGQERHSAAGATIEGSRSKVKGQRYEVTFDWYGGATVSTGALNRGMHAEHH
jgi:hypothetical protein